MNAPTTAPALITIAHDLTGEPVTLDLTATGAPFSPGGNILIEGDQGSGKSLLLERIGEAAAWQRVEVYNLGNLSLLSEKEVRKTHHKITRYSNGRRYDADLLRNPQRCVVLIDDFQDVIGSGYTSLLARHLLADRNVTVALATTGPLPDDSIRGCYPGGSRGYFATQVILRRGGVMQVSRSMLAKAVPA